MITINLSASNYNALVFPYRFLYNVAVVYVDYPGKLSLTHIFGTFSRAMVSLVPGLRPFAVPLTSAMVELYLVSQVWQECYILWQLSYSVESNTDSVISKTWGSCKASTDFGNGMEMHTESLTLKLRTNAIDFYEPALVRCTKNNRMQLMDLDV